MLKIQGLHKKYGNYHALDGLDMELKDGALFGFVGPNGAGKTTTIKIMTGLLKPDQGTVELDGKDMLGDTMDLRRRIGYVPDHFGLYDNLKVSEYMEFFAACYHLEGFEARKCARSLLEQVGLGDRKDAFVDGLSRGMQQRLCLARALIHDPELLIMDEPTAGLDPRTHLEFRQMVWELHEQGKTILLSSHNLAELSELCTDIGIIDAGKMVLSGSMDEIMERIYTSKQIIISVHDEMEKVLAFLKESPMVRTISICEKDIMVGFTGDEHRESELLKQMIEAGIPVRGFMREPGSLESIFMQITDHNEEKVVLSYEDESGL